MPCAPSERRFVWSAAAIQFAGEWGTTWLSSCNDAQSIAGQGTIGLEILQEMLPGPKMPGGVPVGGGGLLAGMGSALERITARPRPIGVQAEASLFMHALVARGNQAGVLDLPTLADGLRGTVESDSVTILLVKQDAEQLVFGHQRRD